jgi:phenylpropionate dioxygenase-like ring-hydroxylating dioxygenase large terminal subunit
LTGELVARVFLNEPIVLFRTPDGRPVALEDRCCHRAAPLSLGKLVGEHLQCGYHGLKFDSLGRCVETPGQKAIPPGAFVRSYVICEKWSVAWIWMGDPALADESKIPDLPWLDSPEWTLAPGYLHIDANYQLIIDNLLDLTHLSYLHLKTLAGDPKEAVLPIKTERLKEGVHVSRWLLDIKPPPLFARAGNFTANVDRWQLITWKPPAIVYFDIGCAKAGTGAQQGDRSQGISMWTNHLLTPETDTSTHYLFGYTRNYALNDEQMTKLLFDGSVVTYLEDKAMLEAQQKRLNGGALDRTIDINADAPSLQFRRQLDRLIEAETVAPIGLAVRSG